ncbi:excitatory amino acid transporter 3-like [Anableps anableps]
MLQMFAVPLIVTSVISGVTRLSTKMSRKIAMYTGSYICVSTVIAVIIGMILVLSIQPGVGNIMKGKEDDDILPFSIHVIIMDLLKNIVPESFIQAFYEQNGTVVRLIGGYSAGANMLGLIIWSFIIGIKLTRMGDEAKNTVEAIIAVDAALKIIVSWMLWYLPFGLFFMIIAHVVDAYDWESVIKLGKLAGVTVLGIVIHSFIVLPMIYFWFLRKNPFTVLKHVSKALMTAGLVASSIATLPVTFNCCEAKLMVDQRVCRFMLPIATSINMNGTALYEVIAAIFVAQLNEIYLDVSQIIAIGLTVAIATAGTAGIPSTGAITTLLILSAVGLPAKDAAILALMEWLLDHFNTVANVLGNCFGVALISYHCRKDLEEMDRARLRAHQVRSSSDIEIYVSSEEPDEELSLPSPSGPISPSAV